MGHGNAKKRQGRNEQEFEHTGPRTYAEATATISNVSVQNQGTVVERWRDILTPSKTPRKPMTNCISYNPFDVLNNDLTEKEGDIIQEIETHGPRGTSTPKHSRKNRIYKNRKANNLSFSAEYRRESPPK
ncbi:hypothetical protein ACJMK2_002137 [Sinanodonta woodiana]|uniref:Uncharacterized protein n=1 Tax=Sinanodonta woodiana TaxID=1069815 RepID=A0ABD3XUB8_SINWO